MSAVADAFVMIRASTTALVTGLNQAKQMIGSAVNQMTNLIKPLTIAFVGIAATADTSGVRINAALKGTGQQAGYNRAQLDQLAASMASLSGTSQRAAREAQNVMLNFGNIRGDTFKEMAKTLPDLAARLGKDLPSAAQSLGAALQNPATALTQLEALGMSISPHFKMMYDKANESGVHFSVLQGYILNEVKRLSGEGAKALSTTLAGATGRVKGAFVDLGDAIAPALVPAASGLASLITKITTVVKANQPAFEAFGQGAAKVFEMIGKGIDKVTSLLSGLNPSFVRMAGVVLGVVAAATALAAPFMTLAPMVLPLLGTLAGLLSPIKLIGLALFALRPILTTVFSPANWGAAVAPILAKLQLGLQFIWTTLKQAGQIIYASVMPAWNALVTTVKGIIDRISAWVEANSETWASWGESILEIITGVVTMAVDLWAGYTELFASAFGGAVGLVVDLFNGLVGLIDEGMSFLYSLTGDTWGGIGEVISSVLDTMSILFNDWRATASAMWTAVQLAAVMAFDEIKYGFVTLASVATGTALAIKDGFLAAWNNVAAAAEQMMNSLRATFAATWAAATALFKGKSPITAFRETYAKEVSRLGENSRQYQNVGEAAANAYKRGYDSVMGDTQRESETQQELKKRLQEEVQGLIDKRDEARNRKRGQTAERPEGKPGDTSAPAGEMAGYAQGLPSMLKVKFETVGFADMWKKMQETLSGGSMIGLAQKQVNEAQKLNNNAVEQTRVLNQINENVKNKGPAVAGP